MLSRAYNALRSGRISLLFAVPGFSLHPQCDTPQKVQLRDLSLTISRLLLEASFGPCGRHETQVSDKFKCMMNFNKGHDTSRQSATVRQLLVVGVRRCQLVRSIYRPKISSIYNRPGYSCPIFQLTNQHETRPPDAQTRKLFLRINVPHVLILRSGQSPSTRLSHIRRCVPCDRQGSQSIYPRFSLN